MFKRLLVLQIPHGRSKKTITLKRLYRFIKSKNWCYHCSAVFVYRSQSSNEWVTMWILNIINRLLDRKVLSIIYRWEYDKLIIWGETFQYEPFFVFLCAIYHIAKLSLGNSDLKLNRKLKFPFVLRVKNWCSWFLIFKKLFFMLRFMFHTDKCLINYFILLVCDWKR